MWRDISQPKYLVFKSIISKYSQRLHGQQHEDLTWQATEMSQMILQYTICILCILLEIDSLSNSTHAIYTWILFLSDANIKQDCLHVSWQTDESQLDQWPWSKQLEAKSVLTQGNGRDDLRPFLKFQSMSYLQRKPQVAS